MCSPPSRLAPLLALGAGLWLVPAAGAETRITAGEPAVVDLAVAALMMSGQEGGAIPMAAAVFARPGAADGEPSATLVLEIDGPALVADVPAGAVAGGEVALDVYVYVLGGGDEVLDQLARRVTVDRQEHREALATGLKVEAGLHCPAGESRVRVLVRRGEAVGLRTADVVLPGASGGEGPSIVALSFPDARNWPVATLRPAMTAGGAPPAALPVLRAGASAEARLLVRRPPPDPWSLRALWSPEGGERIVERHVLAAAPSTALTLPEGEAETYRAATVSFDVPELAPGRYRLSAQLRFLSDEAGGAQVGATASPPVTVYVEARPATGAGSASRGDLPADVLPRRAGRKIERRYLEVLERLAAGDRAAALRALRALETGTVESLEDVALSALEQSQAKALRSLPEDVWQAALPVLLLHAEAVRAYGRETAGRPRRGDLRRHAIRTTVALADAYAQRLATAEARREAAWVLADLAGFFLERGALGRAEALLERALELDPTGESTLLNLAAIHQKSDRPEAAGTALEALLAVRPEHPEGRLRRALNLRRTGDDEAGRRMLRGLLEEVQDWIALLAHQELARAAMDTGELDEALATVRRGLERWPRHASLSLLLAYLLDVTGDRRAATELLEDAETGGSAADAERSRYNRGPLDALEARRGELAERARRQRGALARILGARP